MIHLLTSFLGFWFQYKGVLADAIANAIANAMQIDNKDIAVFIK